MHPVLEYGSADVAAKLVPAEWRLAGPSEQLQALFGELIVVVERGVPEIFEYVALGRIDRRRLGGDRDRLRNAADAESDVFVEVGADVQHDISDALQFEPG